MRRFLFKLTWFLPLLLGVAAVNYTVDPANLFHPALLERHAAEILAGGQNVAGLVDYDERAFQRYWLELLREPPDTVVVGSSRAMGLSGPGLLNHAVSGGTLPDYLAVTQLYRQKGWKPRRLLVVVDPWLFNANNHEPRWKSLSGPYFREREALGLGAGWGWLTQWGYRAEVLSELVSPSYFQAALERLAQPRRAQQIEATTERQGERTVKRTDGSLEYGRQAAQVGVEEVRQAAIRMVEHPPVYGLERYSELAPELRQEFETWLADWRRQGVEVVLVLAPYHPEAYQRLTASPRFAMVAGVEAWLRTLGYPVVGSYQPPPGSEGQFYDGQHPKPALMGPLLEQAQAQGQHP